MTTRGAAGEGFEIKFAIDARQATSIRSWLGSVCRPDGRHPRGVVSSIYFDTARLDALQEKANSDYLKTKVRLRWYDVDGTTGDTAFLEVKHRIGTRRRKLRVELPADPRRLAALDLSPSLTSLLVERLRREGIALAGALHPVLVVRYTRDRYVEPASGTRVALDADISAPAVNPAFVPSANPRPLPVAVVETKGADAALPRVLQPLAAIGGRRTSFSKYLSCYDHAVNPRG